MILFLGPTGSGKSVQGKLLADRHGYTWVSAGELLRDVNDLKIQDLLKQGKLVPDNFINQIVFDRLAQFGTSEEENKVIFDGYPRTISQAKALSAQEFNRLGHEPIEIVIDVKMTKEEIMKRLKLRQREEDTPEIIEKRLKIHNEKAKPLIDYYKSKNVPIEQVDGVGTVGQVHDRIEAKLEKHNIVESF